MKPGVAYWLMRINSLCLSRSVWSCSKLLSCARKTRKSLLQVFDQGLVRVIPREAEETFDAAKMLFEQGSLPKSEFKKAQAAFEKANRLDLRRDPSRIYEEWDQLYSDWQLAV